MLFSLFVAVFALAKYRIRVSLLAANMHSLHNDFSFCGYNYTRLWCDHVRTNITQDMINGKTIVGEGNARSAGEFIGIMDKEK